MCDLSLYVLSILLVKLTLIPKTLTLVLLKALIRTNDNRAFFLSYSSNGFQVQLRLFIVRPLGFITDAASESRV